MSTETVYRLLPEVILVAVATLVYLAGAFFPSRRLWSWIAAGAIVAAGAALAEQGMAGSFLREERAAEVEAVFDPLAIDASGQIDAQGQYVRWLALVIGLALLLAAPPGVQQAEVAGTLLLALVGLMLAASSRELVLLFLGLELISIPTYVLLYLGRRDVFSQEAAAKYFYLSILSSAVTLYGFSFLYGAGGSTDLGAVRAALAEQAEAGGPGAIGAIALVLIFAGLGFKIAAVPFHFYAPDVYQGTTQGNAAVLSVLPKVAGFAALVRIAAVAMPGMEALGWRLALILAMLTMTLANVLALWQDNIRRLLAYSSIAHAGYMLIGLGVGLAAAGGAAALDGLGALWFYAAVYALATTGAFTALAYLGGEAEADGRIQGEAAGQIDGVEELAGLARTHPLTALGLAISMFSLAGIPPLAGFWGKLTVFASALDLGADEQGAGSLRAWFIAAAVVGVLNAAIAAAYYLRIVAVMYFGTPWPGRRKEAGLGPAAATVLCSLLVVVAGLWPGPLVGFSMGAGQSAREEAVGTLAEGRRTTDGVNHADTEGTEEDYGKVDGKGMQMVGR